MVTEHRTTTTRHWSTWLDQRKIEQALADAGISFEDFYPTARVGIWQLEAYGTAKRIAAKMDNASDLASVRHCQDFMDDEPYRW